MTRLLFSTLVCLVFAAAVRGQDASIPIYPLDGSVAPYVDKDGNINPIVPLAVINFGNGLALPLVLNFSSAIREASPEFGQGWECPLFEAKIFDVQPGLKKVELLGGKTILLVYNPRTDTWSHYFDDCWTGKAKGDDFDLTYKTGCKLEFHNGLIASLTTPTGQTISWNRAGEKVESLQETGQPAAISITYDALGFAKQLILTSSVFPKDNFTFNVHSDLVYAGLSKIECPGGRVIAFQRGRDKSGDSTLSLSAGNELPKSLIWDSKTGKILGDDLYNYKITEVTADKSWPRMTRTNKISGRTESYYFDQIHGVTEEVLADGTIRHIETIQAPGPNYKAIRFIQDTKNGKTIDVLRRAFDKQGNLILDSRGFANGKEAIKQFVYDEAGRIVSYRWNGQEVWRNTYDPETGQITEHFVANLGIKMLFDRLPGGDVKESIVDAKGKIASSSVLGTSAWQQTVSQLQKVD